jgi:hypothetical protein
MNLGTFASRLGMGLIAGAVGTAAITVSQLIEMRIRGRAPSASPAKASEKVLDVHPADDQAEQRFAQLVHWGYGTSQGAVRAVLDAAGVHGVPATLVHLAEVQGAAWTMLPALEVAPPVREWGKQELAIGVLHHAIYCTAVGLTYERLKRSAELGGSRRVPVGVILTALAAGGARMRRMRSRLPMRRQSFTDRVRNAASDVAHGDWSAAVADIRG